MNCTNFVVTFFFCVSSFCYLLRNTIELLLNVSTVASPYTTDAHITRRRLLNFNESRMQETRRKNQRVYIRNHPQRARMFATSNTKKDIFKVNNAKNAYPPLDRTTKV